MNLLYYAVETKLFLMVVTILVYLLHQRSFGNLKKEVRLTYLFTFSGILFSALGFLIQNEFYWNLCFVLFGICCFLAIFNMIKYAFEIRGLKLSASAKILFAGASVIMGVFAYAISTSGADAMEFFLVIAVIVLFSEEQYQKMSVDNLTKLYNRYGMDAELKEQLKQYKREHTDSFYMIICDLDNFKHINDTWGHPEGDRALILVANALFKVGKMFDSDVFRIGGDEFVIITDKSPEGLDCEITAAVKKELDNIDFRDDFSIEMSIGVALYDGVTSIDDLLNNADKKMYEAKRKSKM